MVNNVIYEIIDSLAERYIPAGKHKFLHVDSREAWKDLMIVMIENKVIGKKLSTITKLAINWEELLTRKIAMYN
jgi:hypothetical protein